nr:tetraspanin-19-like [Ipomoea batatas]GMC88205.1 tetraspanin-19-like [Ipomoea batatas]
MPNSVTAISIISHYNRFSWQNRQEFLKLALRAIPTANKCEHGKDTEEVPADIPETSQPNLRNCGHCNAHVWPLDDQSLAAGCRRLGLCFSLYMLTIFLLLLAETGLLADVYLNSDWEKDLPEDPSGRFNDFKNFVKNNSEDFQWITLFIVLAQGVSILLATVLRTLGRDRRYERENGEPRAPLLNQPDQTLPAYPYVLGEPRFPCKNV